MKIVDIRAIVDAIDKEIWLIFLQVSFEAWFQKAVNDNSNAMNKFFNYHEIVSCYLHFRLQRETQKVKNELLKIKTLRISSILS